MRTLTTEPAAPLRNLKIAFCGASGTGKTALAKFVAERYELPMCPVGARSVAEAMGFSNPYDVDAAGRRPEFQSNLLREKHAWESSHARFVTDRTPLDNLTYAMMHDGTDYLVDWFIEVVRRNLALYTHVFYCPLVSFQNLRTDPVRVQNPVYHDLFDAALDGLLRRYLPRHRVHTVRQEDILLRKSFIDTVLA